MAWNEATVKEGQKVEELIRNFRWDRDKVLNTFSVDDAKNILKKFLLVCLAKWTLYTGIIQPQVVIQFSQDTI